VSNFTLKKD